MVVYGIDLVLTSKQMDKNRKEGTTIEGCNGATKA